MPKKKTPLDQFANLTWNDFEDWAGSKIVSRGKSYQSQGRVSELAKTDNGSLVAWVDGTVRYATQVLMGAGGLPESICTCPYELDCKHGVAVTIEYLKWLENSRPVPRTLPEDERLIQLEDDDWMDEPNDDEKSFLSEAIRKDIDSFLKDKTKAQLIGLIHEIASRHPEIAQDFVDCRHLKVGNTKALTKRLRQEIRDISEEPGWQNYWQGEGFTPDYSSIRKKLKMLLAAGYADEVLDLGRDLVTSGVRLVEMSDDEGETAMEITACMPLIVEALDQSSLDYSDKLNWALNAELEDQYGLCETFAEYLQRKHPKPVWSAVAEQLLSRLKSLKNNRGADGYSQKYQRDRISDWAIHALERAGRKNEIIPLCEAEAKRTNSYIRLVERLIVERRYSDAEIWIQKGIRATTGKWSGISSGLRNKLREIRMREKNWPVVAAIMTEEFVRYPSLKAFEDCKKTSVKVKAWSKVRENLLRYLEKGVLPWGQKGWPLPDSGVEKPGPDRRNRFPMLDNLIVIAIMEKKPDQVLHWYDRLTKEPYGRLGVDDDEIATAIQTFAPERAVDIWKNKAERLIAQVKPRAYREAGKYLRKAGSVMARRKKQKQWDQYIQYLRQQHARKSRLMETLDSLNGKPIVKKKR